jgi:conserved hypothetical integral membrane protein
VVADWTERLLKGTGALFLMGIRGILGLFRPGFLFRNFLEQLLKIGADSTAVVGVTAFFTGMVLALQAWIGFRKFNAESLVGAVVTLSMTRELGPVITSLMVTGRSGSAMAAEIGSMRVSEQIDALESLAVNPVDYLVTPRFYASLVALPLLTALADLIGIGGGYFVSVNLLGLSPHLYFQEIRHYVELHDFLSGIVKAIFFGGILSLWACRTGFAASGGAAGVGRAVTRAVVSASMSILVIDYFLTAWLF